jgi:predicted DNA-binding transcriptional regulator YafY
MVDVEPLDEEYARPSAFDLAAYWTRSSREYELATYGGSATIRLSPRGRKLAGLLGSHVEQAVAKTAGKPDKRGWVRCTIPIETSDQSVHDLMRLGAEVEVIAPDATRNAIARALRETLAAYER